MRFRRVEFVAIALTFSFICFMSGYFMGSRGAVNIVAVESQNGGIQQFGHSATHDRTIAETRSSDSQDNAGASETTERTSAAQPQSVVVGTDSPVGAPTGADGRININTASRSELTDLPGIGNVLAERIVDYRTRNGAFARIEDIKNVSGIGEKRFEAIMDRITVG